MRTIIVPILFFLMFFSGCHLRRSQSPNVKLDSIINLGNVHIGDTLMFSMVCENQESKEVTIDYIQTPCGCITAYPIRQMIESKDSTQLIIQYVPLDLGYTEQNLFVYFRDYESPIHFIVKCDIQDK